MGRLVLLNPNTSSEVTKRMAQAMSPNLPGDMTIEPVTASFGAPYISDESSYAIAHHAVVDMLARVQAQQALDPHRDAVLIGCFGDPGLFALREIAPCFVTGLAEAAFIEASGYGTYGVVTGGLKWAPMLRRLARSLPSGEALQEIVTLEATGAQMAANPAQAQLWLIEGCFQALEQAESAARPLQSLIIGGAGLVGYAQAIQHAVPCRLIDSVQAGARLCVPRR
jgi:allantoin racemase